MFLLRFLTVMSRRGTGAPNTARTIPSEHTLKLHTSNMKAKKTLIRLTIPLFLSLSFGACISNPTCPGCSALETAVADGHADDVRKLLPQDKKSIDDPRQGNLTLLQLAARGSNPEIVRMLIERGADVNRHDKSGATPLNTAIRYSSIDVAIELVKQGADVNAIVPDGSSPLSAAAAGKRLDLVKTLVASGAELQRVDGRGETPLFRAAESGGEDIFVFLVTAIAKANPNWAADPSPLLAASKRGAIPIARRLIERGARVNAHTEAGLTPLMIAANSGQRAMVQYLMQTGGDIHVVSDSIGNALHAAMRSQQRDIVNDLLVAGSKPVAVKTSTLDLYASAQTHQEYAKYVVTSDAVATKRAFSTAAALYDATQLSGEQALKDVAKNIWQHRILDLTYIATLGILYADNLSLIPGNTAGQPPPVWTPANLAEVRDKLQLIVADSNAQADACWAQAGLPRPVAKSAHIKKPN